MTDLYTTTPETIMVYSTDWCPDCRRAKKFLDKQKMNYTNVNVEEDEKAMAFIIEANGGKRLVPTIIFPDGTILFEPSTQELRTKIA